MSSTSDVRNPRLNAMSELVREHLDSLGLADRRPPDLYLSPDEVLGAPHAAGMRLAFEALGLSGFLCIQGSPTVAFLAQESEDPGELDRVHRALWNQGLASLLLVLRRHELLAYSLTRKPVEEGWRSGHDQPDPRLVEVLDLTARGLKAFHLISAVESGRYFTDRRSDFDRGNRVDAVLLGNLLETRNRLLKAHLEADQAQALLIQVTFIAYLEDRGFLDKASFEKAAGAGIVSLPSLLDRRDPLLLDRLFALLRKDFNGDLFLAPCSFEEEETTYLTPHHITQLAEFRHGQVEMETGQGRFWPYDFRYIPVELISALYDRFLAENSQRQRASGAYFTPRPLADLAVDQAWRFLQPTRFQRSGFRLLDPACGSGIFLVRAFQRLAENTRRDLGERYLSWQDLMTLLEGIHGWDLEPDAVRLTVFSLSVALLEEANPAAVKRRIRQGRLLPRLYGKTIRVLDFFSCEPPRGRFDLVLGNPPWISRRPEETEAARRWCQEHGRPMPGGEMAWAFAWKALELVKPDGLIGFLLPAMGFLFNQNRNTLEARRTWLREVRLHRIINLADLRFQLFEGAIRPTLLCLYHPSEGTIHNYKFDYWCPKSDRHLQTTGVITLPSEDQIELHLAEVLADPGLWSRRMWMRSPDIRLYQWLCTLPRLRTKLVPYRESRTKMFRQQPKPWIIGQGFQPASAEDLKDKDFKPKQSKRVSETPHLESKNFHKWVLPDISPEADAARVEAGEMAFGDAPLRRKGFEGGFDGPHVLLLQGMERATGHLQATYSDQDLTFRASIQGIRFPLQDVPDMKLLTAVLNSKLAAWFLFHEAANPGAERPKVHESELLRLPFSPLEELESEPEKQAAKEIVDLMDELLRARNEAMLESRLESARERFDRMVYRYYGLSGDDIAVIEDAMGFIIPSVQPRRDDDPPLWTATSQEHWRQYFETLSKALGNWLTGGLPVGGKVVGYSDDLVILRLWLGEPLPEEHFIANSGGKHLRDVLTRLQGALSLDESRNLHLLPDLRVFLDDELFLVKPRIMRSWLRSTALDDANAIAGHLLASGRDAQIMGRTA